MDIIDSMDVKLFKSYMELGNTGKQGCMELRTVWRFHEQSHLSSIRHHENQRKDAL